MKLNKLTLLVFAIIVILPLSILLTSCGANPAGPLLPNVFVTAQTDAIVPIPAASATSTGTATFVVTVQGPGIQIDSDTETLTPIGGVAGAPFTVPKNIGILTSGGTGTYTFNYSYANPGGLSGQRYVSLHVYQYHTITTQTTGTFSATYQVVYQ
jgi:hypothetical protein